MAAGLEFQAGGVHVGGQLCEEIGSMQGMYGTLDAELEVPHHQKS